MQQPADDDGEWTDLPEPKPTTECERLRFEAVEALLDGDWAEAERLFREAVAEGERSLGPRHPHVAMALSDVADHTPDPQLAEQLRHRAAAILEASPGYESQYCHVMGELASARRRQGDFREAEALYRRALEVAQANPEVHLTGLKRRLAVCLEANGQPEQAHALRCEVRERWSQFDPNFLERVSAPPFRGPYRLKSISLEQHIELSRSAVERREEFWGLSHPFVAADLEVLVRLLREAGRSDEASAAEARAAAILKLPNEADQRT